MTNTLLTEAVAGLLEYPCPLLGELPKVGKSEGTPYGLALRMFMSACELVVKTTNAKVIADWEKRRADLTELQTALNCGRAFDVELLSSELKKLRQHDRAWFAIVGEVHSALTTMGVWSSALADDYVWRRITSEDACEQFEAAARLVLSLLDETADVSVKDVYHLIAESN